MASRFVRILGKQECDATLSLHAAGRVLPARCQSIGPRGFDALVTHTLTAGQLVQVEFWLANLRHPITLCARVTECNGFNYGFEVVADEEHRQLFAEVLREGLRTSYWRAAS